MCNYRFEESKPVIQTSYTYEENGVLYCTSATQKGVYWYVYALNNPLRYVDPTGQWYEDYNDYYDRDPVQLPEVTCNTDRPGYDPFGHLGGVDPGAYEGFLVDFEGDGDPIRNPNQVRRNFENALLKSGMYQKGTVSKNKPNTPNSNSRENDDMPDYAALISISDIENLPIQDYDGFLGIVKYFWTGGMTNGYQHNRAGQVIGVAPNMGNPPIPVFKGGNVVNGFTKHGLNRAIERGVKPNAILDALKNPLKTGNVVTDQFGRQSQRFIGKYAEVVVNPQTGQIISVNPTSSSKVINLLNLGQ